MSEFVYRYFALLIVLNACTPRGRYKVGSHVIKNRAESLLGRFEDVHINVKYKLSIIIMLLSVIRI